MSKPPRQRAQSWPPITLPGAGATLWWCLGAADAPAGSLAGMPPRRRRDRFGTMALRHYISLTAAQRSRFAERICSFRLGCMPIPQPKTPLRSGRPLPLHVAPDGGRYAHSEGAWRRRNAFGLAACHLFKPLRQFDVVRSDPAHLLSGRILEGLGSGRDFLGALSRISRERQKPAATVVFS